MARIATILSLLTLGSYASAPCCTTLHDALGSQVSFPGDASYEHTEASYNALQEARLKPACILRPSSAQDVARAVTLLHGCRFAIKGGGHNAGIGFANINDGVTIDMTSLASIAVSDDKTVARVGAGAKWVDVYAHLDKYKLAAAGGRNGNVGVGGLLVGGGISHFSARRGWACDGVVNFEVVLGNGSAVSANAHTNADLYHALKGGANNFGVVTRFDIAAFSQGNISSTLLINDGSQARAVFKAFNDIATSPQFDERTSLVTTPIFNSTSKTWKILNIAAYTDPLENPPVFNGLFAVPSISRTTTIASIASIANETEGPPSYTIFSTATFKPSLDLMMELFDIMDSYFRAFKVPAGSVTWVVGFEPVVAGLTRGDNVLGLTPEDTGFLILLSPSWTDDAATDAVTKATKHVLGMLEKHAETKGQLQQFQYLNYAAAYQHPLESYGAKNYRFLRDVSRKYDAGSVFQRQVPGGFKL